MKFGEMLVREGVITKENLKLALERQVIFGGRIGTNLLELGLLKEEQLALFLGKYLKVKPAEKEFLDKIPKEVLDSVSPDTALRYKIVPFKKEKKRLHVAMNDVMNVTMIDELNFMTGYDIVPYVVSETRLLYALEKHYGIKRDIRYISVFNGVEEQEKPDETEALRRVKEAFVNVKERDAIAEIIVDEAAKVASRTAFFMIKGSSLEGWRSHGVPVKGVSTNLEDASVIAEVLSKRNYYRGPMLQTGANKTLISLLGGVSQDCVIIPVSIRDRVVAVLYADNGNDKVLNANLNYLNTLVSMASLAFEILILQKRIMDL